MKNEVEVRRTARVASRYTRYTRPWRFWCAWFLGIWIATATAVAQRLDAPVEARVPMPPTAVLGSDGQKHLAYEVHLTNFYSSNGPLRLTDLSVVPQDSSTPLATYKGKELAGLAKPHPDENTDGITIPAGSRVVLFLWITLPAVSIPPGYGTACTSRMPRACGERCRDYLSLWHSSPLSSSLRPCAVGEIGWSAKVGAVHIRITGKVCWPSTALSRFHNALPSI